MAGQPSASDRVCVAVVATAHGVRGALKLRCFTEQPDDVAAYGPLFDREGRRLFELRVVGRVKGGVLAEADGIDDRDAALALRGTELYVPRSALPDPEPDEFYYGDLIGLVAERVDGSRLGTVRGVDNFGAGDVLEVLADDGRVVDVPFDRASVPEVDLAAGRIRIDPPAGLIEEERR